MMIYKIKPIFIEKLWGGNYYSKLYHLKKEKIGEVVLFSTHPLYDLISTNEYKETLLKDANIELYKKLIELFPITIKLIDAKEDLSIQVHPDDDCARTHHQTLGKEEYWMILEALSSSSILIGHSVKHLETLKEIVLNGDLHQHMNQYSIKQGDMFYIPANTVHAIQKDTRLLEIAQASILNFRVDDYLRKDENGNLRDLHIQEALEVMSVNDKSLQKTFPKHLFIHDIIEVQQTQNITLKKSIAIFIILNGKGFINQLDVKEGDVFVLHEVNSLSCEGSFTCICIYSSLSITP